MIGALLYAGSLFRIDGEDIIINDEFEIMQLATDELLNLKSKSGNESPQINNDQFIYK